MFDDYSPQCPDCGRLEQFCICRSAQDRPDDDTDELAEDVAHARAEESAWLAEHPVELKPEDEEDGEGWWEHGGMVCR